MQFDQEFMIIGELSKILLELDPPLIDFFLIPMK